MQKDVMKDKPAVAEIAQHDKASAALARKVEEDSTELARQMPALVSPRLAWTVPPAGRIARVGLPGRRSIRSGISWRCSRSWSMQAGSAMTLDAGAVHSPAVSSASQ